VRSVERVTGNDIDALRAPAVGDDAGRFCDVAWLRAWEQAFLPSATWRGPLVVHALGEGDDGAWLPLARQKIAGFPVASLAGYYWPYRTAPLGGREAIHALARHLRERPPHAVIRLGPISARDSGIARLIDAMQEAGWRGLAQDSGEVFEWQVPAEAEGIEAKSSRSLLKNVRYARRRLERERGAVACERHVLSRDALPLLPELEAIEAACWVAEEAGETKFVGAGNRAFWTYLATHETRSEIVFWILRVGGVPIAFSAHVETAAEVHIVANNYRADWKEHSPGSILSLDVLTDAVARGRHRVDWGRGDSGYKSRWGAQPSSKLRDVLLFAPGALGAATLVAARRALPAWHDLADHG
jgi:CelD/BcsL family acetyltransferase involved in cellulose biosynthesis